MQSLRYTRRGLRRRNNTDKREVTLSHVDPVTGETVRTSRTVGAKTKKGAEKARDALIFRLESDGGAVGSSMTVRDHRVRRMFSSVTMLGSFPGLVISSLSSYIITRIWSPLIA